jgi:PAS domain-containing protein
MTQNYKNRTGESKSPVFFDRGILDHLIYPACIITSKSILEYVNTPFLDLFGIDSDERKFDWPNVFNSEHKKIVAQTFVSALNGAFSNCTVEVKTAEGGGISVDLLMQPVINKTLITSVLVFIRVLEEEKQSGYFTHSSTAEPDSNTVHYEFSPLPLIRFNRDLKIVRSFEGTLRYTLEDMSKEEWCVIGNIFKYDAERIKNNIVEILKGNIPFKRIGEIKVKSKSGDEKVVNVIIYPVTRDKELAAIDLMMEDITRIRELKERLSAAKRLNLISDIGNGLFTQ